MKLYVMQSNMVGEADVMKMTPAERRDYVEVIVAGADRCRRARIEKLAPDLAEALTQMNKNLVWMAEYVHSVAAEIMALKRLIKKPR